MLYNLRVVTVHNNDSKALQGPEMPSKLPKKDFITFRITSLSRLFVLNSLKIG